ncbi:hypothetical protein LEP1GSC151_3860 [Leptospira interrogans serovar Grippotyphosa str. LT2186]|uniref:Uncharacterized protein n=2 Tax=Leptospira interrogans TaxID=173 RepID=M3I2D1_LEPIR|nr:hypothetical protein LEP1GSC151_3860 [Leptospira interrogans serovar Grippotyphosa str. LT2186]
MECFCSKKEDIIISLMKLMVEKYAFKKDTIRNFLYLLKKKKIISETYIRTQILN